MPERSKKKSRILVIDDDEGLLLLMADALREEQFDVATAQCGADAIAYLGKHQPDLMLLDLQLKDVPGRTLLEQLEHGKNRVPFVVVTGQGDEKVAVEMMKRGALDYIMKDGALLDLLPTVTKRALTAVERDRALANSQTESARLQREILQISAQEQRRIGEDLHDGLGQQLTAIELMCAALKSDTALQPKLAQQVDQIALRLREAIGQVRSLSRGLVPVRDEPDALFISLIELVERSNALGRLVCRFECAQPVMVENPIIAGHLYRIAQEAVNNALKYSQAAALVVELSADKNKLRLTICDNGRGIAQRPKTGMGLQVMQHRASEIGARLTVESRRGLGVTVTCMLDLP